MFKGDAWRILQSVILNQKYSLRFKIHTAMKTPVFWDETFRIYISISRFYVLRYLKVLESHSRTTAKTVYFLLCL